MEKIEKVTPAMLAALPAKLGSAHEATMSAGNSGTILAGGSRATFAYNPSTEELQVTVTHHSIFHLESHVEKAIAANIEKAIAA